MQKALRCTVVALLLQIASAHAGVAGEVVQVKISDLAYSPADITIKPGDTVEWVNDDFIDHTATAKNGGWDLMIAAGKTARHTFEKAGVTHYFCRFHPDMTGSVTVAGK
jgi:plastocyanin